MQIYLLSLSSFLAHGPVSMAFAASAKWESWYLELEWQFAARQMHGIQKALRDNTYRYFVSTIS